MKLTEYQVAKMLSIVEGFEFYADESDLEMSISERDNWECGDVIDVFTKYLNEFIELGFIVVEHEELELLK